MLNEYLKPVFNPKTYANLLYLFMSFPLGLMYFIVLVTGISLGAGLLVIFVGVFILLALVLGVWAAIVFERTLANGLLGTHMPVGPYSLNLGDIRTLITSGEFWRGLIFVGLKFPLGIVSFVAGVTTLAITFGLIFAPFTYSTSNISIAGWQINTLPEALLGTIVGLLLAPVLLRGINALAGVWRNFALQMLSPAYSEKAKRVYTPPADHDDDYTAEKPKREERHTAQPLGYDEPQRGTRSLRDILNEEDS